MKKVTEIDHNKRLSDVLSHAKCPRCNSDDKEANTKAVLLLD